VDIHAINDPIVCFVYLRWATFVIFRSSVIEKSSIYHKELEIKATTEKAFSSSFLDIQIWHQLSTFYQTLWQKRRLQFCQYQFGYIEDFSITEERKITNVAQRRYTKQTIGSFIAWISTEYSYISLLYRLLREYPQNIVIFRYITVYCENIYII
jgi:hypothetical protein